MKQNQGIISSDACRPKSASNRTSPTHAAHEPAPSVMDAVEYCLLHGLKLAGPEHPAILCAQETLSYGALAARVSQFAAGLRETGVRPSDRVGMLMLDTPDLIALHLGAIAAGAIAVAISSRASAAELAQILAIVRPASATSAGRLTVESLAHESKSVTARQVATFAQSRFGPAYLQLSGTMVGRAGCIGGVLILVVQRTTRSRRG